MSNPAKKPTPFRNGYMKAAREAMVIAADEASGTSEQYWRANEVLKRLQDHFDVNAIFCTGESVDTRKPYTCIGTCHKWNGERLGDDWYCGREK